MRYPSHERSREATSDAQSVAKARMTTIGRAGNPNRAPGRFLRSRQNSYGALLGRSVEVERHAAQRVSVAQLGGFLPRFLQRLHGGLESGDGFRSWFQAGERVPGILVDSSLAKNPRLLR